MILGTEGKTWGGDFIKRKVSETAFAFFITLIALINYIYALTPQNELKYEGIDVSDWQGYIDYSQVKADGIEIVYIKSSQGSNIKDTYFDINYENAKANNLKVGFYHFLTATNIEEAEGEAIFFASVISGKQSDCKLALDYEQFNGVGVEDVNQIAIAFIQKIKELTQRQVIIYSDLYNAESTFNSELANEGELWLAYYENYRNLENIDSSWSNFIGIQYTDSGSVSGINGNVDRDLYSEEVFLDDNSVLPSIENSNGIYNTEVIYYTVRRGDTLWGIAQSYGTTVQEIAQINGIQNVNLIYPGQVFKIITNSCDYGSEVHSTGKTYYTVKKRDTLWAISQRYSVSVQEIVNWNNIQNPNLIYPGQRLVIYGIYNTLTNSKVSYIVQNGDCIYKIGRMFGVCPRRIARINGISRWNPMYVGQILEIS